MKLLRLGLCDLLALVAFGTLLFLQYDKFADDPGVGWHLKAGQIILETGAVPTIDPFLASAQPRPWIADQWLSEVILYSLYLLGDWPLLYASLGAIFLITLCGVVLRTATRASRSPIAASIATFIALKLCCVHFILRPVIFSFFVCALVSGIIWKLATQIRRGEAPSWRLYIWLPVLFAVWANLHSSFLLGLVMLACAVVGLVYDFAIVQRASSKIRTLVPLFICSCICAAATLLTPHGFALYQHIIELGSSDYFMTLHEEWLPVVMTAPEGQQLQLVVALLGLAVITRSAWQFSWGFVELIIGAVFLHFAVESVRFLPYFAIISAPLVAQAIASFGDIEFMTQLKKLGGIRAFISELNSRERLTPLGAPTLGLIVIAMLWGAISGEPALRLAEHYGPSQEKFPYVALETIRAEKRANSVVVAFPDWGGFITWQGGPNVKAVIDDRNTVLGEAFFKRFLTEMRVGGHWRDLLKEYGATHLMLSSSSALAIYIRDLNALPLLYQDEVARVFAVE